MHERFKTQVISLKEVYKKIDKKIYKSEVCAC